MIRLAFNTIKPWKFKILVASLLAFFSISASANSGYVNVPDYTAHVYTANGFTPLYPSASSHNYSQLRGEVRVRVLARQGQRVQVYFNNRVQGWVPANRVTAASSGHVNVPDYTAYVYTANGFTPLYPSVSSHSYTQLRGKIRVRVLAHNGQRRQVYFNNRVQGWVPANRVTR